MKFTLGNKKTNCEQAQENTNAEENSKNGFCGVCEKRELTNLRTGNSKTYVNEDGSISEQIYDDEIHYLDTSDAKFKDIDNRLFDTGEIMETRLNRFKTHFNKKVNCGRIYDLEFADCRICLISTDAAKNGEFTLEDCNCIEEDNKTSSKVRLRNVSNNTDFEYTVDSSQVKEDIIVKEKSDKYEYDFELAIDNLYVTESPDGKKLELRSKTLNDVKFYIPSPFMTDAAGHRSDDVYYEIVEQSADLLSLKVVADSDWMNAEDRLFPVKIDPVIRVAKTDYETFYGTYYGTSEYEQGIFRYWTSGDDERRRLRVYVPANYQVISSKLSILKEKLNPYILENLIEAKLTLSVVYGSSVTDSFRINNQVYTKADAGSSITIDVTSLLADESNSKAEITFTPNVYSGGGMGGSPYRADVYFTAPKLELKYSNHVKTLAITVPPSKTHYEPGEKFDPEGMVVVATYYNGETLPVSGYEIYPSGTMATYDNSITVTFDNQSVKFDGITVSPDGFNDRRPAKGLENVYRIVPYDLENKNEIEGNITHSGVMYVRLELCDGAEPGEHEGTPLNAINLNNIKVKASNIIPEK